MKLDREKRMGIEVTADLLTKILQKIYIASSDTTRQYLAFEFDVLSRGYSLTML
jgi:hypothetical protein